MVEMGSGFCSIEEAMHLLNKSRRQIYIYVKKGLIRKERSNGKAFFSREDILSLKTADELNVPFNKQGFLNLTQRVQLLERAVEILSRSMGIFNDPLRFKDSNDAMLLYTAAQQILTIADDCILLDDINPWAITLPSLDEPALKKIIEVTGDKQAWVPFYKTGIKLLRIIDSRTDIDIRMDIQKMRDGLKQGLACLRLTLLIWMEDGEFGHSVESVMRTLEHMENYPNTKG